MMKKITFVFTLFVLAISVNAQFPIGQTIGSPVTLLTNKGGFKSTVAFMVTSYTDTSTANLDLYVDTYSGSMIWTTSDGKLWIRNTTATAWILVSGSSGSVNIYNSDGSLSANRNLTGAGFNLGLQGLAKFGVGADSATFTMNGGAQFLIKPTLSYFLGNVGIGTATPRSLFTVTRNGLGRTQNDSTGIFLENITASTVGLQQNSPGVVWKGTGYKISGGLASQEVKWLAELQGAVGGTVPNSFWRLRNSVNGGTYGTILSVSNGGNVTIWVDSTTKTVGSVNRLPLGYDGTNIFVGTQPMNTVASFNDNTSVGVSCGSSITTASYNTSMGNEALKTDTSGSYNTAIGRYALRVTTNGYSNTGVGANSMMVNTTGFQNTSIGAGSMEGLTTGQENTGVGYDAGLNATTAIRNVWLGWNAKSGTDGYQNEMIGYTAGASLTAGNHDNIGIGFQSMFNASQLVNVTNSIAIGTNSYTTKSNLAVFGASIITETWLRGNVGINTESPAYKLDVLSADAGVFATNIYNNNSATGSAGLGVRVNHSGTGHIFEVLSGSGGTTPRFDVLGNGAVFFNNSAGTLGQVLTSAGNASPPTWETSSSGGITLGTTTTTGFGSGRILSNNAGVVGEYQLTGSGKVVMDNGATFVTTTPLSSAGFLATGAFNSFSIGPGIGLQYTSGVGQIRVTDGSGGNGPMQLYATTINLGNPAVGNGISISSANAIQFPAYTAGAATFDGSGNITSVSDGRVKHDIKPFKYGLREILKLKTSTFIYNQDLSNTVMSGFIAQDVQAVMPSAVHANKDGILSLETNAILAALVEGMKTQQKEIEALRKQIKKQK